MKRAPPPAPAPTPRPPLLPLAPGSEEHRRLLASDPLLASLISKLESSGGSLPSTLAASQGRQSRQSSSFLRR